MAISQSVEDAFQDIAGSLGSEVAVPLGLQVQPVSSITEVLNSLNGVSLREQLVSLDG